MGENIVENVTETQKTKKRVISGRMKDAAKRLRTQSVELGENCFCKRYSCCQVIPKVEQK